MMQHTMDLVNNTVRIVYKKRDSEESKLFEVMRSCVNFSPVGFLHQLHTSQV